MTRDQALLLLNLPPAASAEEIEAAVTARREDLTTLAREGSTESSRQRAQEELRRIEEARHAALAAPPAPGDSALSETKMHDLPWTGDDRLAERYRLVEKVGMGGFGEVWRAEDTELSNHPVAIKLLRPEFGRDEIALQDLRREARVAMKLSHPRLMRLHNLEMADDSPFLVMEFIEGPTLTQVLAARGRLSSQEVRSLARQMCEALEVAHDEGVVHRDLKPSNIMFAKPIGDMRAPLTEHTGNLKITDFGISHIVRDSSTRTTGLKTTGTLAYMAPEQIRGKKADPRSDIYSMGCILYQMVAGHPPFHTGDLVHQHLKEPPDKIADCPGDLWRVISKCLAKEPKDRFQSVREMARALGGGRIREASGGVSLRAAAVIALLAGGAAAGVWQRQAVAGFFFKFKEPVAVTEPAEEIPWAQRGRVTLAYAAEGYPDVQFQGRLDGANAWADIPAGRWTLSEALASGEHRAEIRALRAGGWPSRPTQHTFTVAGNVAPVIEVPRAPGTMQPGDHLEVRAQDDVGIQGYVFALDGVEGPVQPAPLFVAPDEIEPGPHTLTVRALDVDGQWSAPATITFTRPQNERPEVAWTNRPPERIAWIDRGGVELSFTGRDPDALASDPPLRFVGTLGSQEIEVTSPWRLGMLSPGQHRVRLEALDGRGGRSAPLEAVIAVDGNLPPRLERAGDWPSSVSARERGDVTFAFRATDPESDPVVVEGRVGDGEWREVSGNAWSPSLRTGRNVLEMRARDAERASESIIHTVTVAANTAPAIEEVTIEPAQPRAGDEVTVRIQASDAERDSLRFRVNGEETSQRTVSLGPARAGSLRVEVRAIDGLGAESESVVRTVEVAALQPPVLEAMEVTSAMPLVQGQPIEVRLRGSDSDGGFRFEYQVDQGPVNQSTENTITLTGLTAGTHTLTAWAIDTDNQRSQHTGELRIDVVPPQAVAPPQPPPQPPVAGGQPQRPPDVGEALRTATDIFRAINEITGNSPGQPGQGPMQPQPFPFPPGPGGGGAGGGGAGATPINIGQTVNGSLGPGDPARQNGAHFDEYTFNGFNNQLVRITLTSPAFDTFLILIESSGTVTENDDMAQGNLNSFIQRTLSGAGTHRIRVSSFHPNVQGNYTLRLE